MLDFMHTHTYGETHKLHKLSFQLSLINALVSFTRENYNLNIPPSTHSQSASSDAADETNDEITPLKKDDVL